MKKVLLIGDSIRRTYDKYIKQIFENDAEVYYPEDNCRFTTYILRYLPIWRDLSDTKDYDLVHWNAGLWDTLLLEDGKCLIGFDEYKRNIRRICEMLKMYFPNAKFVFATSTPVIEENYDGKYKRYNDAIIEYNEAAVSIVKEYGMEVNDLFVLLENAPLEYHSDQTHWYTKGGTELITEQVRKVIEENLNIKGKNLDYDKYFSEEKDIVGI